MQQVNVRNLDDIQEEDRGVAGTRLAALLLATVAGAAIVTAAVVMSRRAAPPARPANDPLAELVSQSKSTAVPAETLATHEVSFPGILSDDATPTTALAAVRDERGRLIAGAQEDAAQAPPPAAERLPVVPLPIGDLLGQTRVTSAPKDGLTSIAADVAKVPQDKELAIPGMEGGFQLQVASFKDPADAAKLVEDLRRRVHRAYSQAAQVPERGLWHRVRIGPFKSKFEANRYKVEFERSERVSPFVVDPDKVKQSEQIRAARLAAREKKSKQTK
jgi:cell division septation protein DedD